MYLVSEYTENGQRDLQRYLSSSTGYIEAISSYIPATSYNSPLARYMLFFSQAIASLTVQYAFALQARKESARTRNIVRRSESKGSLERECTWEDKECGIESGTLILDLFSA